MVHLRVVGQDARSPAQRAQALHRVRDKPQLRTLLEAVLEPLRTALERLERDREHELIWPLLDQAYEALDRYLARLLHEAEIDLACGPRCSACCTDLPPILPIEALRMVRALRSREDGTRRLQRAVEQARAFQKVLLAHTGPQVKMDNTQPGYREAQIAWRRLGHPCPVLGDDGNCSAYAARPLSCRVHVHLEDPAHCEPGSPRFLIAERPPLWGHPRECEVEILLAKLGRQLDLPGAPNLQWGLAAMHDLGPPRSG